MTLNRFQDRADALGSPRASTSTNTREERDAARRATARRAESAEDCAFLLDMLGLSPVGGEWT